MTRLDWNDLRYVAELARCGSLSETARRLKADHSTVGRRIAALEQALGLKLFDRMPRGYVLTETGARIVAQVAGVESAVFAVERAAAGAADTISGIVRISAPPAFASHWLVPLLAPLRRQHPALELDIVGETGAADLTRREADIALRLSRPAGEGLVARKLGDLRYGLYGARTYLDATADSDWQFIGYDEELANVPQQQWLDAHVAGRSYALRSNDLASLIAAARAGMGLAAVPHILAAGAAELVCVAEAPQATRALWMVVHPDLRRAPRVRATMDHLVEIARALHG
ncbi:MAG: LysR family transcriptional regulator [Pseudolabrys sp.]